MEILTTLKAFIKKSSITANAFVIYDIGRSEILWSNNFRNKREIASLTNIMTFYTAIEMANS